MSDTLGMRQCEDVPLRLCDWNIFLSEVEQASFPGQSLESQNFRILIWVYSLTYWMANRRPPNFSWICLSKGAGAVR